MNAEKTKPNPHGRELGQNYEIRMRNQITQQFYNKRFDVAILKTNRGLR